MFIDHTPRRRAVSDVARRSLVPLDMSPREAVETFRGALYWVAVFAAGPISLYQGLNGETLLNVRNTRRARRLARAAKFN